MSLPTVPNPASWLRFPFLLVLAALFAGGVAATEAPLVPPSASATAQRDAMAKLKTMIGDWTGSGWMQLPQGRVEFHGTEKVQFKLDGLTILVEGAFFHRDEAAGVDRPVHTTLGVIWFDPASQAYRFRSWLATGAGGEHSLELIEDGWRWEIPTPYGQIRYTTRFTADTWHEIGERSAGGEWHQFFEMTLRRPPSS
jgi:hypothetical protein